MTSRDKGILLQIYGFDKKGSSCNGDEYLEHLWWVMHHSDDPNKRTFAVTCYLDESGTHDDSPKAIVAGLVLNRDGFLMFDAVWENMLSQFKIESPLHMKEFGKHGNLGYLNYDERYKLFDQVAKIINFYKIRSVAFVLDQLIFSKIMNQEIRKAIGAYGTCFMGCANLVLLALCDSYHHKDIAFIMEQGNEHASHVFAAHEVMVRMKNSKGMFINVGSLTFDSKQITALQAADVIAWAVRRRAVGDPIGKGFQPITQILEEKHIQDYMKDRWLINLNESILKKAKGISDS
jgi:hypothetical protein